MKKLQLDLPILLPDMDAEDACVHLLTDRLDGMSGVDLVHVLRDESPAKLCLHFDPNLVSLARLQRLVRDAGASVTARYRHETLKFEGMDAADAADALSDRLNRLNGMIHANVNYAAGLIFLAYDSETLSRDEIDKVLRKSSVTTWTAPTDAPLEPSVPDVPAEEQVEKRREEHGRVPAFLPR